jgi:hypothetical protein
MLKIEVTDLYYKPKFEFFNVNILDKVFTGIKRDPNVYVIKFQGSIANQEVLEFHWNGINYTLYDIYEHTTQSDEWRIIECHTWKEKAGVACRWSI